MSAGTRRAFTLVEVLVATSVLTLMVLMLTALMNSATLTVTAGNRHIAADDQARQVFDRMQGDFARMLKRNDVYFNLTKSAGNDTFYFYAETPGYFTGSVTPTQESNLSLVSYQFNNNQLCRLGQGCAWADIAFTPTGSLTPPTSTHVLGNAIFRMETAFLYRQGDTKLQISPSAPTPGSGFQNLEAVIVALGVLDADSRTIVSSGAYSSLVKALPDYDTSATPTSMDLTSSTPLGAPAIDPILSAWRTAINSPTFAQTAGIPAAAASQVRVYQRIIYLQ